MVIPPLFNSLVFPKFYPILYHPPHCQPLVSSVLTHQIFSKVLCALFHTWQEGPQAKRYVLYKFSNNLDIYGATWTGLDQARLDEVTSPEVIYILIGKLTATKLSNEVVPVYRKVFSIWKGRASCR